MSECVHRWRIDEPPGRFSQGTCSKCGAVRPFRNSHPADDGGTDASWAEASKRFYQESVWKSTTEAVFQSQVMQLAKALGWGPIYHTRYSLGSRAGYPDLHLLRGPRSVFIELKTMKGVVSKAQEEWIAALRAAGHEAYVFRPSDQARIEEVFR